MSVMQCNQFKQIFNETIFEKSKADLLEKIALYPSEFIGFKPKAWYISSYVILLMVVLALTGLTVTGIFG
ncbi:MAG: hypothetical protein LBS01_01395 [Prevotellaceae bacterium]|jgi:hypothetical protein|nr:hypothetical protein [Prevotellaceae bacterium]